MASRVRTVLLSCLVVIPLAASILVPIAAEGAVSRCGSSGGHTVCVTVPDGPLSGDTTITITNVKNSGKVISTWMAVGRRRGDAHPSGWPLPVDEQLLVRLADAEVPGRVGNPSRAGGIDSPPRPSTSR